MMSKPQTNYIFLSDPYMNDATLQVTDLPMVLKDIALVINSIMWNLDFNRLNVKYLTLIALKHVTSAFHE